MKSIRYCIIILFSFIVHCANAQIQTTLIADLTQFGSIENITPFGNNKVLFVTDTLDTESNRMLRPWIYDTHDQSLKQISNQYITHYYFLPDAYSSLRKTQELFTVLNNKVYFWVDASATERILIESNGNVEQNKTIYSTNLLNNVHLFKSNNNLYIIDYVDYNEGDSVSIQILKNGTFEVISKFKLDFLDTYNRAWSMANFNEFIFYFIGNKLYVLNENTSVITTINLPGENFENKFYISDDFEYNNNTLYFTYNLCQSPMGSAAELGFAITESKFLKLSMDEGILDEINIPKINGNDAIITGKSTFRLDHAVFYVNSFAEYVNDDSLYTGFSIFKYANDSLHLLKTLEGKFIIGYVPNIDYGERVPSIAKQFKLKLFEFNNTAFLGIRDFEGRLNIFGSNGTTEGTFLYSQPFEFNRYLPIEDTLLPNIFTLNLSILGSKLIQYKSTNIYKDYLTYSNDKAYLEVYDFIKNKPDTSLSIGSIHPKFWLNAAYLAYGNTVGRNYFFAAPPDSSSTKKALWSLSYIPDTSQVSVTISDTTICSNEKLIFSVTNGDPFLDISLKIQDTIINAIPSFPDENHFISLSILPNNYQITFELMHNSKKLKSINSQLTILESPSNYEISGTKINDITYQYSVPSNPNNAYEWNIDSGIITNGLGTNQITVEWFSPEKGNVSLVISNENCKSDTINYRTATGLHQQNFSYTISPNPATSMLKIDIPNLNLLNSNANAYITIFSADGKLIVKKFVQESPYLLNLENLTEGLFYIILDINGTTKTFNFIKLNK